MVIFGQQKNMNNMKATEIQNKVNTLFESYTNWGGTLYPILHNSNGATIVSILICWWTA